MNDRTSAAPPVFFLGPEAAAAAAAAEADINATTRHPKLPFGFEKTVPAVVEEPALVKRGSKQFLGQVWDGVLEKFRFGSSKKDTHAVTDEEKLGRGSRRKKGAAVPEAAAPVAKPKRSSREDERPSKEEVYANYHQLVASGFFSSHAIQSTRQPGPNASSTLAPPSPAKNSASTTPQWPLTPKAATPVRPSPVQSPHSATSSRGKKRPSISMAEDDDNEQTARNGGGADGLHVKKLRKTASTINRDLSVPRTRSASRTMGLRSFSNAVRVPSLTVDEKLGQQRREPNKLVKRVPSKLPTDDTSAPLRRSSSSTRRNASESYNNNSNSNNHHQHHQPRASHDEARNVLVVPATQEGSTRVLRPRRSAAEPLRVRPDANRGIPTVPDIPVKFTYGEDRENDGPWKGLRRTRAA
jgi:hypothetical protein